MMQKEFTKILLKHEAVLCSEDERIRVELWRKNWQASKEIVNPLQSKYQIFNSLNASLKKEMQREWQWTTAGIAAIAPITESISIYPPPPPLQILHVN